MQGTPQSKFPGAKGKSPRFAPQATDVEVVLKLKEVNKFMKNKFTLVCRILEPVVIQTSTTSDCKYISMPISDVSDFLCQYVLIIHTTLFM